MTLQTFEGSGGFSPDDRHGRNFHFGIREHGMAAALNGMAMCKVRPYGATFFSFFDYLQAVVPIERHQPLAGNLHFHARFDRPGGRWPHASADRALGRHSRRAAHRDHSPGRRQRSQRSVAGTLMPINDRPVAIILTRQALPTLDRNKYASATGLAKGAYVLIDSLAMKPQVILIGTGSEVSICIAAHEQLTQQGIAARVVSMPSWELFESKTKAIATACCRRK